MKSHHLVKFFSLTVLASCTLFPLKAQSQPTSLSQFNNYNDLLIASIEQGDLESGWADHYSDRAEVEEGWVKYHTDRGEIEEAAERQRAATEARQQEEERRQAAMEEYQNP
jgi:hypothetical protein